MYLDEIKKANLDILDVFTGADGGVSFIQYKVNIERFAEDADSGDNAAKELCIIVKRFAKLLEVVGTNYD